MPWREKKKTQKSREQGGAWNFPQQNREATVSPWSPGALFIQYTATQGFPPSLKHFAFKAWLLLNEMGILSF